MNNYKRYTLKDTLESEQKALFNVLSTFAGGGGSSTGYRLRVVRYWQSMNLYQKLKIRIEKIIQTHLLYQAILKS
jgi:Trk-type K+ transport system membrane component